MLTDFWEKLLFYYYVIFVLFYLSSYMYFFHCCMFTVLCTFQLRKNVQFSFLMLKFWTFKFDIKPFDYFYLQNFSYTGCSSYLLKEFSLLHLLWTTVKYVFLFLNKLFIIIKSDGKYIYQIFSTRLYWNLLQVSSYFKCNTLHINAFLGSPNIQGVLLKIKEFR